MKLTPKFMESWPSLPVEIMSGVADVLGVLGFAWLAHRWWGLLIDALLVSVYYERREDPNGWSWKDVGQRAIGIVAAVLAFWCLVLR